MKEKHLVEQEISDINKLRNELKENEHSLHVVRTVIIIGFSLIGLIALLLFINGMIIHKSTGLTELDNQVFSDELNRN